MAERFGGLVEVYSRGRSSRLYPCRGPLAPEDDRLGLPRPRPARRRTPDAELLERGDRENHDLCRPRAANHPVEQPPGVRRRRVGNHRQPDKYRDQVN